MYGGGSLWGSAVVKEEGRAVSLIVGFANQGRERVKDKRIHEGGKRCEERRARYVRQTPSQVQEIPARSRGSMINCTFAASTKNVDGAEGFCKILRNLNDLDSFAYLMLLKTNVAANKEASEMRRRLDEDNIEMSSEIVNLLEKVCPK
ncbi:uncharacterized protein LOC119999670 isoform X2 [Tripterygium wilfordii]|uniref:uncharacterized protein LOC119999670 isoform X2 n=1 Tax=Tripterygium wilfordii TaxID=458696 RepID=UPI0018F84D06|nr:uncharacterized protein LOC119999670 isoform X2 [Tripterygium wilfordii]